MKIRTIIIIGIIVIGVIPFATFAIVDRHYDYVRDLDAAAQREANAPKPGDKYYIEPQRKEQLEAIELDLREKILQLHHQKNSPSSFAVNLNHLTKEIVVIVETKQFNSEIEEMISQYPDDVPIVFSNGKFEYEDFSEPFSLVEGTEVQLEGVIMDIRLGPKHQYSFFTNNPNHTFNTGSTGITLGVNHKDDLHGKVVTLTGIRTQKDLGINVADIVIRDSLIPTGNPFGKVIRQVSIDELYQNPDKYYNQIIRVSGDLDEYENVLIYAGVGCNTARYTTSEAFVPDFPSSRHLHDGDKNIGVRIGSHDDLGKVTNPLPDELKTNKVTVTGVFVPNVVKQGACDHVIYKSGYLLTELDDIKVLDE